MTVGPSTDTIAYEEPNSVPSRPPVNLTLSTPSPENELLTITRSRLRQVFLIVLVAYSGFLARDLTRPQRAENQTQERILLGAVALQGIVVLVSRSRFFREATLVHTLEAANLGLFTLVQGTNQYLTLRQPGALIEASGLPVDDAQILIANTWLLPWLVLASSYPLVVPHPWRRAMAISAAVVIIPALVSLLAAIENPTLLPFRAPMLYAQFALWGLIALCLAVYAARQAELLRKEAFEAKQFGRYKLVRKIGQGGMGEVYLAEHSLLRRPSVVKLIRADRARDPKTIRRFEREVQQLATMTHWNTVSVFDYGHTTDGTFYYVMEYLPGYTLDQLVAVHGVLPPARCVYLLRQVCQGLREAHLAGLIHRDVKPSNVMVCQRGGLPDVAKVLDFGLVRGPDDSDAAGLTGERVIMGTPSYLSPEQARGDTVDRRSDIYSLGATAYFVLTGRPPFDKPKVMDVIAAHLVETPIAPSLMNPAIPEELSTIVLKCLAKSPDERYVDMPALEAALASCPLSDHWSESSAAVWWADCGKL